MWRHVARRPRRRPHRDLPRPARLRRQRQAAPTATPSAPWRPTSSPSPARSGTSASRWPGTTAARWSPSAPGSTTPTRSPTWPASTCCRRSTCGTCCTAPAPPSRFHLYLMAQPPGLPEQMIAAERRRLLRPLPRRLDGDRARSRRTSAPPTCDACRAAVPSIVADYRASAGVDVDHDRADRDAGHGPARCRSPCSSRTGAPPSASTRPPSGAPGRPTSTTRTVDCGHFMAEEAPDVVTGALRQLLARTPVSAR